MSKQQNYYIYVIAFDSGTLKAGRAADVVARLSTHRREAARHGVGVTAEWYSAPCGEFEAVLYERRLLDFCASQGPCEPDRNTSAALISRKSGLWPRRWRVRLCRLRMPSRFRPGVNQVCVSRRLCNRFLIAGGTRPTPGTSGPASD